MGWGGGVLPEVLRDLTQLLTCEDRWNLLEGVVGAPMSKWPEAFKVRMRNCVLCLVAQVSRRLVKCYDLFPWALAPIADPAVDMDQKLVVAHKLFDAPLQSLDPEFSRKVRALAGSPKALVGERWQAFLFDIFNTSVISTAVVECMFASYKQWLTRLPRAPTVPLLQGKSVVAGFLDVCSRKRKRVPGWPHNHTS